MAGKPTKTQYEKQIIDIIGRGPNSNVNADLIAHNYLKNFGRGATDKFVERLMRIFTIPKGNKGMLVGKKRNTKLLNAFKKLKSTKNKKSRSK
tara:strand:- start:8609 stop:8887 length:279 start_codon:yes stop_codon:yes gene_type:complete